MKIGCNFSTGHISHTLPSNDLYFPTTITMEMKSQIPALDTAYAKIYLDSSQSIILPGINSQPPILLSALIFLLPWLKRPVLSIGNIVTN